MKRNHTRTCNFLFIFWAPLQSEFFIKGVVIISRIPQRLEASCYPFSSTIFEQNFCPSFVQNFSSISSNCQAKVLHKFRATLVHFRSQSRQNSAKNHCPELLPIIWSFSKHFDKSTALCFEISVAVLRKDSVQSHEQSVEQGRADFEPTLERVRADYFQQVPSTF